MFVRIKILIFLLIIASFNLYCQIYSVFPHGSIPAAYQSEDSVFIFNRISFGEINTVSISARPPDGLGGWSYEWFRYNPIAGIYTGLGAAQTVDTISTPAGYQMIATKGAVTDTFRVWIVFNDFNVRITSKDEEGNLPHQIPFVNCSLLQINSRLDTTAKQYYNPFTGTPISIPSTVSVADYSWSKDKESGSLPTKAGMAYVSSPPWEDTRYVLTVKDDNGLVRKDSVFYESVQPKADLEVKYISLNDRSFYPEEYSFIYSWDDSSDYKQVPAPAWMKFINSNSENAVKYQLVFGDRSEDSITYTPEDTILHRYLLPGSYTVKFYAWGESPYNCVDSVILDETDRITLLESYIGREDSLIFPNVFTPNEDGFNATFRNFMDDGSQSDLRNEIFRPVDVSIYDFSIIIFNRYGKKVHEYNGNIRQWKGWDGKVLNSDRNATEGVYYYVVDMVLGYRIDEQTNQPVRKEFKKKQQTGFVHLYRRE